MRLKREAVEQMMSERPPDTRLEDVLEVFEVFASSMAVAQRLGCRYPWKKASWWAVMQTY